MRTIKGRVTCSEKSDIPEGAIATISVIDCSRMDAPALTLGQQQIKDPRWFPLVFEVEYDDEPIKQMPHGSYALGIRIGTDAKLSFINDTRFSIVDQQTGEILKELDAFVKAL